MAPRFGLIYADPPWRYVQGGRCPPYPTMPTKDICALPVPGICAPDCVLFLWATYPMLHDALAVMRAWGFAHKTCAFTWVKQSPKGEGFHFGMGHRTRATPEICLLGTRGRPKRINCCVANLVIARRREHSKKPDEVRERIVALCGDLPRAEIFAR